MIVFIEGVSGTDRVMAKADHDIGLRLEVALANTETEVSIHVSRDSENYVFTVHKGTDLLRCMEISTATGEVGVNEVLKKEGSDAK